jgi:hypothetical protein
MGWLSSRRSGTIIAPIKVCNCTRIGKRNGYAGTHMTDRPEKRTHRRLDAQYDISIRIIGSTDDESYSGCAANVSSGGLYFETVAGVFERGDLLKVELAVPPTLGLLEFGGKIAGFARVLRADKIGDDSGSSRSGLGKYGVALQFCRPPKLCL